MAHAPRSMTGAGSARHEGDLGRIEVDARSVNHRFLKTSVRGHGPLPPLDVLAEARVREQVARGHVTLHVRYVPPAATTVAGRIDAAAFDAGADRLKELCKYAELPPPTAQDVLRLPGVISDGRTDTDTPELQAAVAQAMDDALADLVASRSREGARLAEEVRRLLDAIGAGTAQVAARAAEVPDATRTRLRKRIAELLEGTGVAPDEGQLEREVAWQAERSDIREEVARLEAHVAHGHEILAAGGPVGRSLDFLVQELHRETNTVGSKSGDLALSQAAMALKADVERLREQVQNLA